MAGIFTLERPMVPRMITYLYWLAIILIALGLLRGLVIGARIMTHAPHPRPAATQSANQVAPAYNNAMSAPPAANAPANPPPGGVAPSRGTMRPGMRHMAMQHFGPRRRFFHGPRFHRPFFGSPAFLGPMMRGMPPAAFGILRILGALIHAAVLLAIARILAEVAGSAWHWFSKKTAAA